MTKRRITIMTLAVVAAGAAVFGALALSGEAPAPVVGVVSATGAAEGAEVSGLAVTPLRTSLSEGDADVATTFTLTNTSEHTVVVTPGVVELSAAGAHLPNGPASAAAWVTVVPIKQSIRAGDSAEFVVTVKLPKDREPGERRIGVIYRDDATTGAAVGLSAAVGTSVFVPGPGTVERSVALGHLTAPRFTWSRTVDLAIPVRNDGNVHRDFWTTGTEIAATSSVGGAFTFQQGVVLPGDTSVLHGTWQPPALCWCEVAVAMPTRDGSMATTRARVLVARPWVLGIVTLALLVLGALALAGRRRRHSPGAHTRWEPDADPHQRVRS